MTAASWLDWPAESLAPLGGIALRRMFGGHGVFRHGGMFGIVVRENLHLKAGPVTEKRYREAGSQPFRYTRGGRQVALGYWQVPEAVLEEPEELRAWAAEASALANPPHRICPRPPR